MSTSLLYHGFGIRGYEYRSTEYRRGEKEGSLHRVAACVSYRTLKRSGV